MLRTRQNTSILSFLNQNCRNLSSKSDLETFGLKERVRDMYPSEQYLPGIHFTMESRISEDRLYLNHNVCCGNSKRWKKPKLDHFDWVIHSLWSDNMATGINNSALVQETQIHTQAIERSAGSYFSARMSSNIEDINSRVQPSGLMADERDCAQNRRRIENFRWEDVARIQAFPKSNLELKFRWFFVLKEGI